MLYRIVADLLLVLHLLFIVFAVAGAWLVLKWRWVLWLHIPSALWAMLIEFQGWICPLTPLEQSFRHLAGQQGYRGGFVEHYILPLVYPADLTREVQIVLGMLVFLVNLVLYGWVITRTRRRNRDAT